MNFLKEMFAFILKRKKFWLVPVLLLMVILGAFLVLTASSPLAPFIYTIF